MSMTTFGDGCIDCNPKDDYGCPYCGHNCDMQAKTIHGDEDGHCCKCGKDCLMSSDGTHMVAHPEGCC